MSDGRFDRSRDTDADAVMGVATRGFAITCLVTAVAVLVAARRGSQGFVLVGSGLAGGSLGAFLSMAVDRLDDERRDRSSTNVAAPWFHRGAAALSLGLAATIVLLWGAVLEAVIPGYGAATTVGLITYAILASTLPWR